MKEDEEIRNTINQIHDDVIIIKTKQSEIINKIQDHDNVLYGNGKEGLITSTAIIKREAGFIAAGIGVIVTSAVNWIFHR